jgi:hypothetical protein
MMLFCFSGVRAEIDASSEERQARKELFLPVFGI